MKHCNFAVLRTPSRSIGLFKSWTNDLAVHSDWIRGAKISEQSVERDSEVLARRAIDVFRSPDQLEALWIASPSLFEELSRLASQDADSLDRNGHKVALSLSRYLARTSARAEVQSKSVEMNGRRWHLLG